MRGATSILICYSVVACSGDGDGTAFDSSDDSVTATATASATDTTSTTTTSATQTQGSDSTTSTTGATDSAGTSDGTGVKFDVIETTGPGTASDSGSGMGCEKVDILFSIDDSGSMSDNQDKLTAAFPSMAQTIDATLVAQQGIDYRIGVISSNPTDDTMCLLNLCGPNYLGRLQHTEARVNCSEVPTGRWIEGSDGATSVANQFTCIASLEQAQDFNGSEQGLEATRMALVDRVTDAEMYNAGFLRDDALLVLVLVTDEDDQSVWMTPTNWPLLGPGNPSPIPTYYDWLVNLKGGHPENVVVVAISGPENGGGETDAPRIHQLLASFTPNSYWTDISGADYSTPLQEALEVIQGSCDDFIPPQG